MRMGAAKIPFDKIEIAEEARHPWRIFRELFVEPPTLIQQINRYHFEIFAAQNRCVVEKISFPVKESGKKKSKSKSGEGTESLLICEKASKEAEEHKYLLLAGFMPFKLSMMFSTSHVDVSIVRESMAKDQKQLFVWFDLLFSLQSLPKSKLSLAFDLVKQHCPEEVAHEFLRGKVTQERFCKQLGFARSTLNSSRAESEPKKVKVEKPTLKDILAPAAASAEVPDNGR